MVGKTEVGYRSIGLVLEGYIMLAFPSDVDPLTSHFYIVKLGVYGGIHFFLIFPIKIDHWYIYLNAKVSQPFYIRFSSV